MGIVVLVLFLLFTAVIMLSFTMIIHGGCSPGAYFLRQGWTSRNIKLGVLLFPLFTWLPLLIIPRLIEGITNMYYIVFLYLNLVLTILGAELSFTLSGKSKRLRFSFWLHVISGALMILILLAYHFNWD